MDGIIKVAMRKSMPGEEMQAENAYTDWKMEIDLQWHDPDLLLRLQQRSICVCCLHEEKQKNPSLNMHVNILSDRGSFGFVESPPSCEPGEQSHNNK